MYAKKISIYFHTKYLNNLLNVSLFKYLCYNLSFIDQTGSFKKWLGVVDTVVWCDVDHELQHKSTLLRSKLFGLQ